MTETEKKIRKLTTAWRDEPICPKCHVVLGVVREDGITSCPDCNTILFVTKREKTEYLILS